MIVKLFMNSLKDRITAVSAAVFSVLFSVCLVLTHKVHFSGNLSEGVNKNYIPDFHITDILLVILCSAAVFVIVNAVILLLNSRRVKNFFGNSEKANPKKIFRNNFIITFFMWFIFFLTFYPGVGMNDSLWIIKQPVQMAGQHPILYNLLLSGCVNIGKSLFHSANAGIAIYSVLQMLIMNACISFCVSWFAGKGCPKIIAYIIGLSFAFLPIAADYSIAAIKDSLFSAFIMLFIPLLYETAASKGAFLRTKKGICSFILLGLALSLVRNNGSYVVFGLSVIIFFMFKNARKMIVISVCIILAVSSVPNAILKSMGIQSLFQESAAIPLQQIGMVVAKDRITEPEDKEFIENLLPLREFKSNYAPMTADNIKWDGNFNAQFLNEHPKEFLSLWFRLLKNNKILYIKSYLLETYGFWSIGTHHGNQAVFFDITNTANNIRLKAYLAKEGIKNESVFPDIIQQPLVSFYRNTCVYFGAGSCFWLSMFAALMLIVKKKYRLLIILAPCTFVWLTLMISAPIAFAFRYVFMYVLCLPFFIVMPLLKE